MRDEHFQDWLADIIASEHPDESIVAYYFGIFESDEYYTVS